MVCAIGQMQTTSRVIDNCALCLPKEGIFNCRYCFRHCDERVDIVFREIQSHSSPMFSLVQEDRIMLLRWREFTCAVENIGEEWLCISRNTMSTRSSQCRK